MDTTTLHEPADTNDPVPPADTPQPAAGADGALADAELDLGLPAAPGAGPDAAGAGEPANEPGPGEPAGTAEQAVREYVVLRVIPDLIVGRETAVDRDAAITRVVSRLPPADRPGEYAAIAVERFWKPTTWDDSGATQPLTDAVAELVARGWDNNAVLAQVQTLLAAKADDA